MELDRLEKVELRDAWQTEDRGFTPWLARIENVEILSQEIGINLEVEDTILLKTIGTHDEIY